MHGVLIAILLTVQTAPAPDGARGRGACQLLTAEEIHAVQGVALKERKPSGEKGRDLTFEQCFFASADFAHSVSLTVITGNAPTRAAARAFWQKTFDEPRETGRVQQALKDERERENAARRIAGLGEQAFWTGDTRTGALYVRSGSAVLRISVGGVADQNERLRRSTALATLALKRLQEAR